MGPSASWVGPAAGVGVGPTDRGLGLGWVVVRRHWGLRRAAGGAAVDGGLKAWGVCLCTVWAAARDRPCVERASPRSQPHEVGRGALSCCLAGRLAVAVAELSLRAEPSLQAPAASPCCTPAWRWTPARPSSNTSTMPVSSAGRACAGGCCRRSPPQLGCPVRLCPPPPTHPAWALWRSAGNG